MIDIRHVDSFGASRDVGAIRFGSDLAEDLSIHFRPDLFTLVNDKLTPLLRIGKGNPCSLVHVAKPYSKDANSLISMQFFCNRYGLALLIFAVGKNHDGFMVNGLVHESIGRDVDRLS